jgi:hypothetical protein
MASLPWPLRALPGRRREVAELGRTAGERLDALDATFDRLTAEVRRRAPQARLVLVDYLTILPPAGQKAGQKTGQKTGQKAGSLTGTLLDWGRDIADRIAAETRDAAERAGCDYVAASAASRDHHAWSAEPWTRRFRISPHGGAPYHPNAAGMRAVAALLEARLS